MVGLFTPSDCLEACPGWSPAFVPKTVGTSLCDHYGPERRRKSDGTQTDHHLSITHNHIEEELEV